MSTYNFDEEIERRGTGALKYDALNRYYGREDLMPLWIADMDFATPPFVIDAIRERLSHPIFGYTAQPENYWETICQWIQSHHGWKVSPEWMSYIPGIVKGIGMIVNVFVKEDEKIIIQPPVYHPFRLVPQGNQREVVMNPLIRHDDGTYNMDFEGLERVADERCRLLILSNPHNPGGIVWDRDTLERLASFCASHNIIVVSDEIHCDMTLWGNRHIPFASISDEAAMCSITFGAPSKTFNIAGIVSSYAIIPNETLRKKFFGWLEANELGDAHLLAPIATMAAFQHGEAWRKEMLRYIEGNIEALEQYCAEHIPGIKPLRPQASFLVWLDCRELHLDHDSLVRLFVEEAHLALNDGEIFGAEGAGYMRMNVALPRTRLLAALERLAVAVGKVCH